MSVLNLPCSICASILRNVNEIYGANCGHLFHSKCLSSTQHRYPSRRCPKCRAYAPTIYKLYETPEEIANINALEMKVQTLTKDKKQLQTDHEAKTKQLTDLQTESEKEIAKLKSDIQRNGNNEKQLHDAYKNAKNEQLQESQATNKEIERLKTDKSMFEVILKSMKMDYDQRIEKLKTNLADFMKEKFQLEAELHAMKRQLEQSDIEIKKFKSLAQASEEKASRLLREYGRRTSDLKEALVKEKDQMRKELDYKNKQLTELQTDSEREISQLKADIRSKDAKESLMAYNKELNALKVSINAKSRQINQIQLKYNNDMGNLKTELQSKSDSLKKQQLEIDKLKETIKNLQEKNARQSTSIVVLSTEIAASLPNREGTTMNTKKRNESSNSNTGGYIASTDIEEIAQLKEKLNKLEHRVKFMTSELDKEILKSTQLEVDKLKLQSYVDCMKSENRSKVHQTEAQSTTKQKYIGTTEEEVF